MCTRPTEATGLIGSDFMNGGGAECGKMLLVDVCKAPREHSDSDTEHEALTIFVEGKKGCTPNPA